MRRAMEGEHVETYTRPRLVGFQPQGCYDRYGFLLEELVAYYDPMVAAVYVHGDGAFHIASSDARQLDIGALLLHG